MPAWNGNEFLLPDGRRPAIRTFTPRRVDPEALELDLEIVVHGGGVGVRVGGGGRRPATPAAISGPGRGYADRPRRAGVPPGRRRDRDPRHQPAARGAARGDAGAGAHRGRATPTAGSRCPTIRGATVEWCDLPPARRPATRSSPPCAGADLPPAPGCGSPAKPRPCSASAATCSRTAASPGRRPPCAATGSTAAAGDADDD